MDTVRIVNPNRTIAAQINAIHADLDDNIKED